MNINKHVLFLVMFRIIITFTVLFINFQNNNNINVLFINVQNNNNIYSSAY